MVLVVDQLHDITANAEAQLRQDLEKTEDHVLDELTTSIDALDLAVNVYQMPSELAAAASLHPEDLAAT